MADDTATPSTSTAKTTETKEEGDAKAAFSVPDELSDIVLEVDDREMHFNRAVLAHYSGFFRNMFFGNWKEKKAERISLTLPDNTSYTDFMTFLRVLFPQSVGSKTLLKDTNLEKILGLAEYFQADHVKAACQDYLGKELLCLSVFQLKDVVVRLVDGELRCNQRCTVSEAIDKLLLYVMLCDRYGFAEGHRQAILTMIKVKVTDIRMLQKSPLYKKLHDKTKCNILEVVCGRLSEMFSGFPIDHEEAAPVQVQLLRLLGIKSVATDDELEAAGAELSPRIPRILTDLTF